MSILGLLPAVSSETSNSDHKISTMDNNLPGQNSVPYKIL